jgi:peptide/nickel transport system permease protein
LNASHAPPAWLEGGNSKYLLGTDHVGRDILSRVIYGARISLMVAAISLVSGLMVGTTLGVLGGYFGRWLDELLMRIVDIWLGMPFLLVALVVAVVLGARLTTVMGLLALLAWSSFVRNTRADVLSLKTRDYVTLARVAGASDFRIISRHILPGVVSTIPVIATLRVGQLILAEASLSFLGAGIPAPTPAWGVMVAEGRQYLSTAWWTSVFPGLAIFLTVMSLNFLGDWLRDRLDPRIRQL